MIDQFCRDLVTVKVGKECRNNLVNAINPEISGAAKLVFDSCGADYDGPADCSDSCSIAAGVVTACQVTNTPSLLS